MAAADAQRILIGVVRQLEGLHREIVNAIANLAVRNKDDALKTILTQQGITFNVGQPESTVAPPLSQAPEAKGRR